MSLRVKTDALAFVYMVGGALAEIVACLVRVPMDVVKQRRQTVELSSLQIAAAAYRNEGVLVSMKLKVYLKMFIKSF